VRRGGTIGLGALVVVLLGFLAQRYMGVDLPLEQLTGGTAQVEEGPPPDPETDPDREVVAFIHFVIDDLQERTWPALLGDRFRPATLVLFREATPTACGLGTAGIGPFYCPADQKVYIDLSFYETLRSRLRAPGDFAQAYVLAHEVGHHVQNLLGHEKTLRAAQRRDPARKNELSVRFELQADCLAGVWGHAAGERDLLEPGDLEEGLAAAAAIGDDTLQERAGGGVDPESWTHGSSEQRVRWLRRGLETGEVSACDTTRGEP